jgi:hypothetical protein
MLRYQLDPSAGTPAAMRVSTETPAAMRVSAETPAAMPADAVPVGFVLLGHLLLDSPPLPGNKAGTEAADQAGGDPGAGPDGWTAVPGPPEMSAPLGIMAEPGNLGYPS